MNDSRYIRSAILNLKTLTMKNSALVLVFSLGLASCGSGEVKDYLPESNGPLNQVIVVMENDMLEGEVGATLKSYLAERQLGLGVDEPKYDIRHLTPDIFKGAIMRSRAVVYLQLDTLSRAHIKRDMYATPQHLVVVKGRNSIELIQNLHQILPQAIDSFKTSDLKTAQSRFNRSLYSEPRLRKNFGIELSIPSIYRPGKFSQDFAWIDRPIENGTMNLLVYTLDANYFSNEKTFLQDLIAMRDSIGKAHVPGPDVEGVVTYMQTEPIFRPYIFASEVAGYKSAEIRGMWDINGYPMAGPFVTYVVNDTVNNRKVVLEGFVFAPNKDKRDYLFELEAIIKTLKIVPQ